MKKYFATFIGLFVMVFGLFAQSPYISKVWDYSPAPGQYVNELPEYEDGDDANDMRMKADECLADNAQILISLGGWGGSVTFGFDHMIQNVPGAYDLKILGNAFYANANPKDTTAKGGSAEPGIVLVSYDANHNGRPDDEWYELAGSEYHSPQTHHNYAVTYTKSYNNVPWRSNQGEQGVLIRNNRYHNHSYYPLWVEEDSLQFTGSRLRDNARDESGNGSYYVQYMFDWGYVDNQPNESKDDSHVSEFMIDWAVDQDGKPVQLPGIHFVRVYTGVLQQNGDLGECSTEVMGAWDLHLLPCALDTPTDGVVDWRRATVYDLLGNSYGLNDHSLQVPVGIYILRANNGQSRKVRF